MPEKRSPRDPRTKVMVLSRLGPVLKAARRSGCRVVFTNGVFDLLHLGHTDLLRRARLLGDLLVVGVNSDASVRRIKGPGRPFLPERQRALMLASLEVVDYVVKFSGDTPMQVIKEIRPDILVKGGDWKADKIVGKDIVESLGGRTVRLPVVKGFSTTEIARKIKAGKRSR